MAQPEQVKSKEPSRETGVLKREQYFPTLIYFTDLPGSQALNERIKDHIYAWQAEDPEGIVRSNVKQTGSWHSALDMHRREEYRELTIQILAAAGQVFKNLQYDPDFEAAIDNMWANINPRYAYNRNHIHPGVLWSGVYYVQAPPEAGNIFFTDPRPQAHMIRARFAAGTARPREQWNEVFFEPVEGRLLLFPAWQVHEVQPNMSEIEGPAGNRISVSFNIFQRRRSDTQQAAPEPAAEGETKPETP
ncbi:MAG: TIGR02466 family protein [Alphaproteobacteria bacterium]|nr:TIGR02466 family protein [Alphaproteobacteria bacterium]